MLALDNSSSSNTTSAAPTLAMDPFTELQIGTLAKQILKKLEDASSTRSPTAILPVYNELYYARNAAIDPMTGKQAGAVPIATPKEMSLHNTYLSHRLQTGLQGLSRAIMPSIKTLPSLMCVSTTLWSKL